MDYDNGPVRRQDRLLDEAAALELLRSGEYGVLSMVSGGGKAYGVPLNYVWDGKDRIYIHCAPEGFKLRSIENNPAVSFCVVGRTNVLSSKFTTEYESVILDGRAYKVTEEKEKRTALELLLDKYSPEDKDAGMAAMEKSSGRTGVIGLEVSRWSGKTKKVRGI